MRKKSIPNQKTLKMSSSLAGIAAAKIRAQKISEGKIRGWRLAKNRGASGSGRVRFPATCAKSKTIK
jgi:hypothetical protein